MKFLMFLLFFVAAVWFVGLVLRATFSRWIRGRAEEFERAAKQAQKEAQREARSKREGEVSIETTTVEKRVNCGVGEYVEFKEVIVKEEDAKGK